jgi:hypothetical protein
MIPEIIFMGIDPKKFNSYSHQSKRTKSAVSEQNGTFLTWVSCDHQHHRLTTHAEPKHAESENNE